MITAATDTIAAIATAPGHSSIAVIRVSGPASIPIVSAVFRGRVSLENAGTHSAHHGILVDGKGEHVDEVVVTLFRSPQSYSGEDVVEIGCHGGTVVPKRVLDVVLESGARLAEPGEFTRRAFLNGKIDLTQAEAVMDLIGARSERAVRVSLQQLEGRLGKEVKWLRDLVLGTVSLIELDLDFSEEGLEVIDNASLLVRLGAVKQKIESLLHTYQGGRVAKDGVRVVLTGRPNAGKSSVFNAVLRESRAIVTPHPGTTRDRIDEVVDVDGVAIMLSDTAGIRETEDAVEREGVRRSVDAIRGADVVALVVDPWDRPSATEVKSLRDSMQGGQRLVWIVNKSDTLACGREIADLPLQIGESVFVVSAKSGDGIEHMERGFYHAAGDISEPGNDAVVSNRRHYEALAKAGDGVKRAFHLVSEGASNELLSFELREAAGFLSVITGAITTDDVLNEIFGGFCVGK